MNLKSFGDFYEVSDTGNFYSKERITTCPLNGSRRKKRKLLKPRFDKDGYVLISLYWKGKQINFRAHRIIAILFIPNPDDKPFVNHKNGIKNDNRVENLEWCDQSENELHAIKYLGKTQPRGKESKLSTKMLVTFPDGHKEIIYGQNEAARKLNLDQANIFRVLNGTTKHTKGFVFERI